MVKVAINGFGRIGRNALKILLERRDAQVVAINKQSCSLLQFLDTPSAKAATKRSFALLPWFFIWLIRLVPRILSYMPAGFDTRFHRSASIQQHSAPASTAYFPDSQAPL